ncbi:MAG: (3S)-malyl-CoA thioesterase [Gammaproteobacteria bacterium]
MKPVDAAIRRSVLITPGSRPDRVKGAAALPCDSVVIDLEDGVAPAAKVQARESINALLADVDFAQKEKGVRINQPGSDECDADLAVIDFTKLDVVWVPKVESAEQVERLSERLPQALPLVLSIETPRGLFAAQDIAAAGAKQNARCALFFGSGDYCMETGARPSAEGLQVPKALIVAAAAMYNLQAIDAAYFLDPKDPLATRRDAELAKEQGFDGKLLFHPAQIQVANEVFAPNAEEIARAQRLIDAFDAAQAAGQGTLVVDGAFLALDTVIPLRRTIWLAQRLAQRLD